VLSGSAVPFLTMTMVRLCLVKAEGVAFLLGQEVVEGAPGALAAFWAHVRGVVVVAVAGC